MNILLDAHVLGQHETGNETYVRELLRQAHALEHAGVRITAAVTPSYRGDAKNTVTHAQMGNDVARLTRLLPQLAIQTKASIVHVTYHGPLAMTTPMVVSIHDVSYRVRPRYHRLRNVLLQNALGYWTARRARLILTLSEFSRAEIERIYPFAHGRVAVTFLTSEYVAPPAPEQMVERLRAMGVTAGRFALCICQFQPRKNLSRLARAFLGAFPNEPDTQLVLAGDNRSETGRSIRREFEDAISRGRILLPGYVSAEDAACLYRRCACFAFPSLYEGFGLPVLEAMRAGAPVVASSTTSLPEVSGNAALLVDPTDETAITQALRSVMSDSELAASLRAQGLVRARRFGDSQFVTEIIAAYGRAMTGAQA